LPIEPTAIDGVQWFGGTHNAYLLMKNDDDIYAYCHYFHCGLDLLAPWGTPVTAGVNGVVVFADCDSGRSEGPCKVQVAVGDYVITYGHLNDMPLVLAGDPVNPGTILGGVGTNSQSAANGNRPDPGQNFPHIHLEIRGPGGHGGPSINPLLFMNQKDVALLVDRAAVQSDSTMGSFYDGNIAYLYPPPANLMPDQIIRYGGDSFFP
jgi:murein DD-endopeptidase MepM/ murein hydrolase activator NlpD